MNHRYLFPAALAGVLAIALVSVPASSQIQAQLQAPAATKAPTAAAPKAPATTAAVLAAQAAAKPWTAPRTSWGDPDLQGTYSNLSEDGTPMERPDQFAGRKLEDIKGAELAAIKQAIQDQTIKSFQSPLHAPQHFWQDDLNLVKGSQAWLVVDPPDGKIPALTQEGKDRAAAKAQARRAANHGPADSWEDRSLYDRCITRGLPGSMMPVIYGNSYDITQAPGVVAIRYEMIHETRIIPTDGRPHAGANIRSYMGDARGKWEGDTLVVETTNFRDEEIFRGANSASLVLTERFTRIGPKTVKWSVTVNDPKTWTKPWTFSMPLTMDDSQPVLEYGCHEGNYGMRGILSAARAEEKAAEEKKTAK